jgi:hypothetical protein
MPQSINNIKVEILGDLLRRERRYSVYNAEVHYSFIKARG